MTKILSNYGAEINVSSIKSDTISKIIKLSDECKAIEMIGLFGSSLEDKCTKDSDIDLAIVSNLPINKLFRLKSFLRFKSNLYNLDINQEYDFLYFSSLEQIKKSNDFVCRDILDKGKIIYKRLE